MGTKATPEQRRRWYEKNRESEIAKSLVNKKSYRQRNRDFVDLVKKNPCVDCGNTYISIAMEFDHVRGEKSHDVSFLVHKPASLETIKEEIEKCDLVCVLCHRYRTYARMKTNIPVV